MLSILEKRVNEKILKIGRKKNKLANKLTNILESELEINELIDAYDDIKRSKRVMIIYFIAIIISILLMSISSGFSFMTIYMIITSLVEKGNIKENKKRISNSEYKFCKNKEDLDKQLQKIEVNKNEIKQLISLENINLNKYRKIKKEIGFVKELENSVVDENDGKFYMLKDLYLSVPLLVFDTVKEYNNYMNCDNQFRKGEMISAKILSKRK